MLKWSWWYLFQPIASRVFSTLRAGSSAGDDFNSLVKLMDNRGHFLWFYPLHSETIHHQCCNAKMFENNCWVSLHASKILYLWKLLGLEFQSFWYENSWRNNFHTFFCKFSQWISLRLQYLPKLQNDAFFYKFNLKLPNISLEKTSLISSSW